jgi:RHS repeat-associated protein
MQGGIKSVPIHLGNAYVAASGYVKSIERKDIPYRFILLIILVLLSIIASILLLRIWEHEAVLLGGHSPFKIGLAYRLTALLALTAFLPLACTIMDASFRKNKDNNATMAALALWGSSQNTRGGDSGNPGTTSGQIALYKPGTNFYVSIMNGSTDMVTDENGNLIAKFAYEPFGRINLKATNLDVDGDETEYVGGFWYTGQEYEFESDLYDFKARTYDPQSGRFMQPDPMFTARAGYDSYDGYQYVNNDPVNKMDPDGRQTCLGNVVGALALGSGGPFFAAAVGVFGNYTGGGGSCSQKMPDEKHALMFLLYPFMGNDLVATYYVADYYYEHYLNGNGPSFLGKLRGDDLKYSMLAYNNYLQNDANPENDSFALITYLLMTDKVSPPVSGVDEASYYHDKFGPHMLDPHDRKAAANWISTANRNTFSHDSWSRTFSREKNATPKRWGWARNGVATINAAATWTGDAIMTVTGTILFGANVALTGTKNLNKPHKWRL